MESLPIYISIFFGIITAIAIWFFYKASNRSKLSVAVILIWLILQGIVASSGFYTITNTIPPRFTFLILPPVIFIIILFTTKSGKNFIDNLNPAYLVLFHTIRIAVEIVLFLLCIQKVIPSMMTFEGRNFDIVSGLTAPFIYYFGFIKKRLGRKILQAWNFICLALLINIVITAVLSAPFPFQQFAFDQPNIAILYFPFIWLPCFIVPAALFCHLASIRRLLKEK